MKTIVSQMNGYFESMPTKKTAILPLLTEFKKQVEEKAKAKAKAASAPSSSSDPSPPLEEEFYPPVSQGRKKAIQKYVKGNGLHGFLSPFGTMILENIYDLKSWKTILRIRDEDTMNSVVNVLKENHPDWFYTVSHNVPIIETYLENAFKVSSSSSSPSTSDDDVAPAVTLAAVSSKKKSKKKSGGGGGRRINNKDAVDDDDALIEEFIAKRKVEDAEKEEKERQAKKEAEKAETKEIRMMSFVDVVVNINDAMKKQDVSRLSKLLRRGFYGEELQSFVKSMGENDPNFPRGSIRTFASELGPGRYMFLALLAFNWATTDSYVFVMFDLYYMTYDMLECFIDVYSSYYSNIIADYAHLLHIFLNGANYYDVKYIKYNTPPHTPCQTTYGCEDVDTDSLSQDEDLQKIRDVALYKKHTKRMKAWVYQRM